MHYFVTKIKTLSSTSIHIKILIMTGLFSKNKKDKFIVCLFNNYLIGTILLFCSKLYYNSYVIFLKILVLQIYNNKRINKDCCNIFCIHLKPKSNF